MKLVDMKLPKKSKKEMEKEMAPAAYQETYPWGLQLSLDQDQVEKFEALKGVGADATVKIQAQGFVRSVTVNDTSDEKKKRQHVEIQITRIGIDTLKSPEEMSNKEYRAERGKKD